MRCEVNTPRMESRVLRAGRARFRGRNLDAVFEHGQWWLCDKETGGQWVDLRNVTLFSNGQREAYHLPIGGEWARWEDER